MLLIPLAELKETGTIIQTFLEYVRKEELLDLQLNIKIDSVQLEKLTLVLQYGVKKIYRLPKICILDLE